MIVEIKASLTRIYASKTCLRLKSADRVVGAKFLKNLERKERIGRGR